MLSSLCNYIYDKFFSKPALGQKRKYEEWIEYPAPKQMRIDTMNHFSFENSTYEFMNMNRRENYHNKEDECFKVNKIFHEKNKTSPTMARQSIRVSTFDTNFSAPLDKRKMETKIGDNLIKQSQFSQHRSNGEFEVEKYLNKNISQKSGKVIKNKTVSNRVFQSYQPSNTKQNTEKARSRTFQGSMKKSLNFLQESYRLSEKVQYMQLLQQQTLKLNSLLLPFTFQKINQPKETKSSIPVIDLTKENKSPIPLIDLTKENNKVVVDRSRENIPWTSSWTKSQDNESNLAPSSPKKDVPRINSLQDILKTHPVTEKHVVDEILQRHFTGTAEKRRQLEIEAAKLKVLTATNRKAYRDALEEKLRHYMRITTPAVEDVEPEKDKYALPELSKEQESKVSSVLISSPSGEVIVEKFGLQIKRRDLQTLKGLNWLNDEVINFYMNLIMERGKKDGLPSVYAFNTFFYPKLISGGHSSLKRWTKKVDIFSHDLILVPVHLEMHWCMAVIDFRSKEIKYYDSMGSTNNRCLQALLSYLEAESLDKKKVPYSTKDWEQINAEDIPQQMNGSDCGVFSCVFAEHLARDSPLLFSQDNMPYFRRKMTLEIVESKLLT